MCERKAERERGKGGNSCAHSPDERKRERERERERKRERERESERHEDSISTLCGWAGRWPEGHDVNPKPGRKTERHEPANSGGLY